jgi:ribose transport system permease protein
MLSQKFGYVGFVLGCLGCGTLLGFLIGMLYNRLNVPSMIVTVGVMLVFESVAVIVAGGEKQTLDPAYRFFSSAPGNFILAILAFLLMYFILNYTKIGTYCAAIGSNEFTAKNMGINVKKYKLIGFMLLHFFVGVMAILSVSYGTTMTALTGMSTMSRNFQPLMGTFFGVAFRKYGVPITAIVVGEFIISMIFSGFVALGAPTTIQNVVTGAALLIIVTLTARGSKGSVVK